MHRTLLLILLTALSALGGACRDNGYSEREVTGRLADAPLAPIEGLWRLVPDGATIVIERSGGSADRFEIVVVKSPDRSVRPGTVMGSIAAGSDADVYDARIFTQRRDGRYFMPRSFTLTLDDTAGRLEFRKHKSRLRINLWHFVPFLWRHSVRLNANEREYMPGAVRLYPSPAKPLEPVYL